jgi:hypothetical protein
MRQPLDGDGVARGDPVMGEVSSPRATTPEAWVVRRDVGPEGPVKPRELQREHRAFAVLHIRRSARIFGEEVQVPGQRHVTVVEATLCDADQDSLAWPCSAASADGTREPQGVAAASGNDSLGPVIVESFRCLTNTCPRTRSWRA